MITAQSAMKRADDRNDAMYTNYFCDLDQTIKKHADKGEYECTFKMVNSIPTKILLKLYSVLLDCGFKIREPYRTEHCFCIDISWDLKEENKNED